MSVIDQRSEQLSKIHSEIKRAPTFGAFLQLQQRKATLEVAMQEEWAGLAKLAQGWVFVPPRTR